jgi:rare lipoprotein A
MESPSSTEVRPMVKKFQPHAACGGRRGRGVFRIIPRLAFVAVILTTGGCGALGTPGFLEGDGAPPHPMDVAAIPNSIHKVEARSQYGDPQSYTIDGQRYYVLHTSTGYAERGVASWYGTKFHNRRTSSGEDYDMYAMTAAHKTLPLPTYVQVTNLNNGAKVIVKVNDRGPFLRNRLIDLSYAAAAKLGMLDTGTAPVEVRAIDPKTFAQRRQPPAQHTTVPEKYALYLQVGAFLDRQNAEQLRSHIKEISPDQVRITTAQLDNDKLVYRVRIGPLPDVNHADSLADTLSQHGYKEASLVVY